MALERVEQLLSEWEYKVTTVQCSGLVTNVISLMSHKSDLLRGQELVMALQ